MKTHVMFIGGDKNDLNFFLDALSKVPDDDGFKCTYSDNTIQGLEMLKYLVPDYIFLNTVMSAADIRNFISVIAQRPKLDLKKTWLYGQETTYFPGLAGCISKEELSQQLADKLANIFTSSPIAYSFMGS
jgi:hypothetical protein